VKKPQLITITAAAVLTAGIYFGLRTVPENRAVAKNEIHSPDDGHNHAASLTIDTFLAIGKKQLTAGQAAHISQLENSISRGAVKDQQVHVYHELARFWADSVNMFEPYAWYTAEASRLENSEKSLTFAARLFLENLLADNVIERRKWKAEQAKDLFERSLKINPADDSAKVGLGACYLFGGLSVTPMEGIQKIKEVADRDSTNTYALMMLAQGSLMSEQYDKAISRLDAIARLEPRNDQVLLMLAYVNERIGKKKEAIGWYERCLVVLSNEQIKAEVKKRVEELKK
jgi:tetratricopeptide (TPR) repeat protein